MTEDDSDTPSFDLFGSDDAPSKSSSDSAAATTTSSSSANAAPASAAALQHKCWFCARGFSSVQALDAHLLSAGHFVCSDCLPHSKRIFSTKQTYRQHRSVHRIMSKYRAAQRNAQQHSQQKRSGVLFDEAWLHVYAYLDAQALARCETVSTQFQALVSSERCWEVWKHLVVQFCVSTNQRPPNTQATGVTVHWKKVYEHFAMRNLSRVRMHGAGRDGDIYQFVRLLT
jgi:hypothetical protein